MNKENTVEMRVAALINDHWGLGKVIEKELANQFTNSSYVDSSPFGNEDAPCRLANNILLKKILFKLFKIEIGISQKTSYLLARLKSMPRQDSIVLINPNEFSIWTIRKARRKTKNLHAIFLDSLQRAYIPPTSLRYFDKVFSFDLQDCQKNPGLVHQPNFIYSSPTNTGEEYDASVVMSQSFEREHILQEIEDKLREQGLHRFRFHILRINNNPPILSPSHYDAQKLTWEESASLSASSKILIDIVRDQQTGLSFRVFEALGLHKKLITNNPWVKHYDFYDEDNILVIDPHDIRIPESFLTKPYKPIPPQILAQYHISTWIKNILGE